MAKLSGKTVAILTEDGFEEIELTSPKKASEVGYSLSKIEKILSLQPEQKKTALQQEQVKEIQQQ